MALGPQPHLMRRQSGMGAFRCVQRVCQRYVVPVCHLCPAHVLRGLRVPHPKRTQVTQIKSKIRAERKGIGFGWKPDKALKVNLQARMNCALEWLLPPVLPASSVAPGFVRIA